MWAYIYVIIKKSIGATKKPQNKTQRDKERKMEDYVNALENMLFDGLTDKEFLLDIICALDIDTKKEIYEWIATNHDLSLQDDYYNYED